MDEISNKAITIGVAIFITIAIVSGVFYVINQIKAIYGQVYETDVSIQSMFSEFDEYENAEKSGVEVLSTVKKYLENPLVKIRIGNNEITSTSTFYTQYTNALSQGKEIEFLSKLGEQKYISSVTLNESTGITYVLFSKK